jgi:hypothetical protein
MYCDVPVIRDGSALATLPELWPCAGAASFVSATDEHSVERRDAAAHWRAWLTTPVDFCAALERAASVLRANADGCFLIVAVRARPHATAHAPALNPTGA